MTPEREQALKLSGEIQADPLAVRGYHAGYGRWTANERLLSQELRASEAEKDRMRQALERVRCDLNCGLRVCGQCGASDEQHGESQLCPHSNGEFSFWPRTEHCTCWKSEALAGTTPQPCAAKDTAYGRAIDVGGNVDPRQV